MDVFRQIFIEREYRCLDNVKQAGLIIDCGANVGYSSAYFLSRYAGARLIAVEPAPDNFSQLEANLSPYGDRFVALRTGIWSHSAELVIGDEPWGDGREWARTVRVARPGETPMMKAVDIGTLFDQSGADRISILKIDIEGSEIEVFSSNYDSWLKKVDNLVIELHGDTARSTFLNAIAHEGFRTSQCDELFVCHRPN